MKSLNFVKVNGKEKKIAHLAQNTPDLLV